MPRAIRVDGDVAYVPLTRGYTAIIDADDVHMVSAWSWYAMVGRKADGSIRTVYGARKEQKAGVPKKILMHRVIAQTPDGLDTDHQDGNGLNNRRTNLRAATPAQNQFNRARSVNNTSGFKGVNLHKESGRWQAHIKIGGKKLYLGRFDDIADAAAAYASASAELYGEFGRLE